MPRGRKPLQPTSVTPPEIDQERFTEAMDAMRTDQSSAQLVISQHQAAVRAVAQQVGYQLPADCTDPDIIQRDIAANMRRSVEACLEVGRGLAVLKQACEHGAFVDRLNALGLDRTVAARFMQAAVKFSNVASTQLLSAAGNQTKLFELLVLDDDQVEELNLTGQTGELNLDDIASMSVKELRAALREARAEEKAKAELLAEKNRLLDAERAKVKRQQLLPPDEKRGELLKQSMSFTNEALAVIGGQLRMSFVELREHEQESGGDSALILAGLVDQIQKRLHELRDEFMLPDNVGDGVPEWVAWSDENPISTVPEPDTPH